MPAGFGKGNTAATRGPAAYGEPAR